MLNVAVIGTGTMGKHHARVYSELDNTELVAVCDINTKKAKYIAKKYGCKWYKDYKEMFNKEKIDAVSIVTPTSQHEKVAVDVAGMNKHLLVEKPIASSVESAKRIINEARKNHVKLMIGHIERFNPIIQKTKKVITSGKVGDIYSISSKRIGPFYSRVKDVGVILDLAVHDLDVIYYLLNEKPEKIFCFDIRNIPGLKTNYETCAHILLKFKSGKIGSVEVNCVSAKKIRELMVVGSSALLNINYIKQELIMKEKANSILIEDYEDLIRALTMGEEKTITLDKEEPLKVELEHFVNCIEKNREPLVTGEDGIFALKLALAVLRSANTGKIIEI